MTGFTGLAVGVSEPRSFECDGHMLTFTELPQAAEDAERVASWLGQLAGRVGNQLAVRTILGPAATRESILSTLFESIRAVPPNGTFVFVLEGHGTDVADVDHDEPDGQPDQAWPTATDPILDDEIAAVWQTRPDITMFSISDSCRAESNTVDVVAPEFLTAPPTVHFRPADAGPSRIQFAGSARGTDAGDVEIAGDLLSGRFTQALLRVSDPASMTSYESWFAAVNGEVSTEWGEQRPVLYYRATDRRVISGAPAFLVPPG
jgi:hypothetical protein